MVFAWLFLVACVHLRVDAQDLRLYGLRLSASQGYPSEKEYKAVSEKAAEVNICHFIKNQFLFLNNQVENSLRNQSKSWRVFLQL